MHPTRTDTKVHCTFVLVEPMPDSKFDRMADACILAGEHVFEVGSPELKTAMRLALFVLGREIAANEDKNKSNGRASERHYLHKE